MRRTKSWFALALAVAGVAIVTGCGGGGSSSGSSSEAQSGSDTTASASCTPKHKFETVSSGELTVAAATYPPYANPTDSEKPGTDIEVLDAIAKLECLSVKLENTSFAAVITGVQSGRFDVAAGAWVRTVQRENEIGQSDPTFLLPYGIASKNGELDTVEKLIGKSIGTTQGFSVNADLKKLLGSDLHEYPETAQAYQDYSAGRLDGVFDTFGTAEYAKEEGSLPSDVEVAELPPNPELPFTEGGVSQLNVPYSKGNTALGEALNADIAEIRKTGELAEIAERNGLPASQAEPGKPFLYDSE